MARIIAREVADPLDLTLSDVEAAVEEIRRSAADYEAAHSREDALRDRVLAAIAAGHPDPIELAHAALRTGEIAFPRHCA